MSGMGLSDLVEDLRGILMTAGDKFDAEGLAFARHLQIAALDLGRFRRRTLAASLTLIAEQEAYAAPANFVQYKITTWGDRQRGQRQPWDQNFPGSPPRVTVAETAQNTLELHLWPVPSAAQIADLGASFPFFYYAGHVLNENPALTTVRPADRHLLLVRATAAALQELAHRGSTQPVRLGDGFGTMAKNGTPAALASEALELFERMAA
jgi:hypothetical protein